MLHSEFKSADPIVITDEQRVIQVLFSLQSNALKYTPKGEVKHIVEIKDLANDEKLLKISVTDTGLGIKEEDQGKLFKLFGQVQNNQGLNQGGIGLGLVIIEKIVH